jgi:hypothetical protein
MHYVSLRYPEGRCEREIAHGLCPMSLMLNQWCSVGTTNHDFMPPPKTKNKINLSLGSVN